MEIRDLEPMKDPKGGTGKTPTPQAFDDDSTRWTPLPQLDGSAMWRTLALVFAATLATGIASFIWLGIGNIKESEFDRLLESREVIRKSQLAELAPYIHDKQRIQDQFDALRTRDVEAAARLLELQKQYNEGDAKILQRILDLEIQYYREHPKVNLHHHEW